ncbi:HAMP domain-containing histidine kinase [Skermania sp. ID1734]|uniref:sensor histidine kinase n=1 Tax=Skermania sp. ID1734 TaxID=2597516 RepID=UPI00118088B6|nr:HAMP domain-containing sensor histidine kinase [Skermania sp. ID1734]TSD96637.1 HAMP domain-containing histidine kinase [Skermania sp. ID1734]
MRRAFSLRARVAAATALGAAIIVVILGFAVARVIEANNLKQIDQRIDTASRLVMFNPELAVQIMDALQSSSEFALTIYADGQVKASTPVVLPELSDGYHTVRVNGVPYRVRTTPTAPPVRSVSLALPAADAEHATTRQQREVAAVGAIAIAAAAGLGWLFGGRAVRPIVELTRRLRADPPQSPPNTSGVREANELADAVRTMLQRVDDAQAETAAALTTARDFSAAAAHELRTPLTAMRTDIEVLRTLDLDDDQRAEILTDLQRAQGRVEATLSALERLASGELAAGKERVEADLVELLDLAAHDAKRHYPDLEVAVESAPSLVICGLPVGLRLAIDNAISNAVKHGGAHRVRISARRDDAARIVIAVDDDGRGIPPQERTAVFKRFYRGADATSSGSGLGLALVAQQAQLHGGTAYFEDSPLGGARLVLEIDGSTA